MRTSSSSASPALPVGRVGKVELPEGLLELPAHAVERRVRLRRDRRADVVDRQADRPSLERGQLRRLPEDVAVQLLVDPDDALVLVDLRVHRVAPAAEVDEVEQRQRVLELLARDREPRREVVGVESCVATLPAGREDVREECLQDAEPLGRDRPDRPVAAVDGCLDPALAGKRGLLPVVALPQAGEAVRDRVAQRLRLERDRAAVLPEHPAREWLDPCEARLEDAVLEHAGVGEGAMHPPGGVSLHGDPGRPDDLADLPGAGDAVRLDVEVGRQPEVPLAAGRKPDVAADARDPERADGGAVEILPDDVPDALVEPQRVRVEGALRDLVPLRRPVGELDRALLRDRRLELRQAPRELRRVVGRADAHALGGVRAGLVEAGPAEREILQREPQRLGVRELAVEVEERRLERGELVVLEVETIEEVVLGAEGVELLAGELVALGVQRHPETGQLGAVGVEAPRERLVRHLRVALDVALHVAGGQRPALGHQEGDERELADELVGVVRHRVSELTARAQASTAGAGSGSLRDREVVHAATRGNVYAASDVRASRCWCDGQ